MTMRPTWVPFTPWTTLDDYREMLEFIEREDLVDHVDPVQYSIRLLVPPGSLLLESPAMHPHLGPLVEGAFHYRWTHPDARMDRLQEQVARMVAAAADAREDAAVTAARVRALADAAGGPAGPGAVPLAGAGAPPAASAHRSRGSAERSPLMARWPSWSEWGHDGSDTTLRGDAMTHRDA